jgi:DNA mismatch repair protein MSH6
MLMSEYSEDARIAMYHMACQVDAEKDDVTFLYKFSKGVCPKSHGMK